MTEELTAAASVLKVCVDLPRNALIQNIGQQFSGWVASEQPFDFSVLRFLVEGEEVQVTLIPRPDVEQVLTGHHATGWHFLLDRRLVLDAPGRTITLEVLADAQPVGRRVFCRSRHLLQSASSGPLYFMHIPKTAGTSLRHLVDYVFADAPSLLVYGDSPGVPLTDVLALPRAFLDSREIVFGHFDYVFTRLFGDVPPKIVTVLRRPSEMMRSYLDFTDEPIPEFLDNPLVRHLSGLGYNEPFGCVTEEHFRIALHHARKYCFIALQERLQEFADEFVGLFGLPRYQLERVNETAPKLEAVNPPRSVDVRFDTELYEACCKTSRSLQAFLDS